MHNTIALEDMPVGGSIQNVTCDAPGAASGEMYFNTGLTRSLEDYRHLADRVSQRACLQFNLLRLPGNIPISKLCRSIKQFAPIKQQKIEGQAAIFDRQAKLHLAGQDFFFDHSGHAGLPGPGTFGSMRIRVGGESAVNSGGFVKTLPLADAGISFNQGRQGRLAAGA